jgi:predicted dehydrogenase
MYKALVIGCGNIGAMYDFERESVLTHTKALIQNGNFEVSVFDINVNLAQKVARKYSISHVENLTDLKDFDVVCIATPTDTHIQYLKKCIEVGTKVVLCEKPISTSKGELLEFIAEASNRKTKILVNYIRAFQPSYQHLKKCVEDILLKEKVRSILIKYKKGFMNNASHAFQLMIFLLNKPLNFDSFRIFQKKYDFFRDDPTITAFGFWDSIPCNIIGFTDINFDIFEIEVYFENQKIVVRDGGNNIEFYKKNEPTQTYFDREPDDIFLDCLKDYMKPVISEVERYLKNETITDNFEEIANLNLQLINLMSENGNCI